MNNDGGGFFVGFILAFGIFTLVDMLYADDCPVRFALRRHMIPSETPIGMRQLLDQQWLPISHSVAWLDTVIDYAERELRGEV
jgi:hypothetical protein